MEKQMMDVRGTGERPSWRPLAANASSLTSEGSAYCNAFVPICQRKLEICALCAAQPR